MLANFVIARHTTAIGFEEEFRECEVNSKTTFLCLYVHPITGWSHIIECSKAGNEQQTLLDRGYVLADYRAIYGFMQNNIQLRSYALYSLQIQQRKIRDDLEWLFAVQESRQEESWIEIPCAVPIPQASTDAFTSYLVFKSLTKDGD